MELKSLFANAIRPDVKMSVSEWANKYRYLTGVSAKEAGKLRVSRTPYLREVLDELSPLSKTITVTMIKGAQVGASEAGNSWIGSIIHHTPGPMLVVQPNGDMVAKFSKQRLDQMIASTPELKARVAEKNSKDGGNSTKEKSFLGGVIYLAGAHSPAQLRSMPARFLFLDEISNYDVNVGGEGDPLRLAKARTATYGRHKKIFQISTPGVRDICRIETEFKKSDQRYYHVPCPHCGDLSVLYFNEKPGPFARKRLVWDKDEETGKYLPKTAHLVCENCGAKIEERQKTWMFAEENGAKWIPTVEAEEEGHKGYHLSSLYSAYGLGFYWKEIVADFLHATSRVEKGDVSELIVFTNNMLAETWVDQGTEVSSSRLWKNREEYPASVDVPAGGLFLTAGADVQKNRIEVSVYAWGKHEEAWAIQHKVIPGNPIDPDDECWSRLSEFLFETEYAHESGRQLRISAAGIDSGGDFATNVYDFVKGNARRGVFALKGDSGREGAPYTKLGKMHVAGRDKRQGVLVIVGTFTIKHKMYGQLSLRVPEEGESTAGFIHYPIMEDFDEEFFEQITAERIVEKFVKGYRRRTFINKKGRNEAIDCLVYAFATMKLYQVDFDLHDRKINGTPYEEVPQQVVEPSPVLRKTPAHRARRPRQDQFSSMRKGY